eukprot:1133809-Pelagomonas_calceolata.AAC.1
MGPFAAAADGVDASSESGAFIGVASEGGADKASDIAGAAANEVPATGVTPAPAVPPKRAGKAKPAGLGWAEQRHRVREGRAPAPAPSVLPSRLGREALRYVMALLGGVGGGCRSGAGMCCCGLRRGRGPVLWMLHVFAACVQQKGGRGLPVSVPVRKCTAGEWCRGRCCRHGVVVGRLHLDGGLMWQGL